jgi:hypothetical protein
LNEVSLQENNTQQHEHTLLEFAEILPDQNTESCPKLYHHITSINTTLSEMQRGSNGMAMEVT